MKYEKDTMCSYYSRNSADRYCRSSTGTSGEFYGSVYLNGNPAPAGAVIVAKINGEPRGELTTTVDGLYGGPDNFILRLIVSSTEEEVNAGNATVTFFVGGVQAFQIVPFRSGNSENLICWQTARLSIRPLLP